MNIKEVPWWYEPMKCQQSPFMLIEPAGLSPIERFTAKWIGKHTFEMLGIKFIAHECLSESYMIPLDNDMRPTLVAIIYFDYLEMMLEKAVVENE